MTELGRMCHKLMLMIAALGLVTACASGGSAADLPASASSPQATLYRLDAGDEVRITAYGLDALNNNYVVSDSGVISLPLIDNIQARGKTVGELQSDIAKVLFERQILRSPSVNVQVTKYRPFYILGEVKSPGEYPYRPGMSVLTAVSMAGGFTFRADQKNMTITRAIEGRGVTGRARENTTVLPGDTIRIKESWF
ncbi:polysaccharide biosynthesis/export family protein [Rhizorhapis suberifaciens]|uniref:Polysaccharide export outer membrane protein n=1 Tax=Rhizorhapis suberifaciens TaxID=13656 RepID=A0A840HT72_9SPHN|nr:polysaccharide biosynthesis/export family protein [Rhizorhapis suberifaciens]MBB4640706.1 polysaccharide export outer membrane protein [Rhizorhapis suberifaciens]